MYCCVASGSFIRRLTLTATSRVPPPANVPEAIETRDSESTFEPSRRRSNGTSFSARIPDRPSTTLCPAGDLCLISVGFCIDDFAASSAGVVSSWEAMAMRENKCVMVGVLSGSLRSRFEAGSHSLLGGTYMWGRFRGLPHLLEEPMARMLRISRVAAEQRTASRTAAMPASRRHRARSYIHTQPCPRLRPGPRCSRSFQWLRFLQHRLR